MAFEKIFLANGEPRAEYVERRLKEGATSAEILAEINAPELFTGTAGAPWGIHVVNAAKHKLQPKAQTAKADLIGEAHPTRGEGFGGAKPSGDEGDGGSVFDAPKRAVPAEVEGILDETDVAEVYEEAAKAIKAEQRKKARADLLAKVKADLAREAKEALKRGALRGDMVDVYMDLAPYAESIKINGEPFHHGSTYRVTRDVAAVLNDQMQRSWHHQDSISGKRDDFNRKRNARVSNVGAFVDGRMVRA